MNECESEETKEWNMFEIKVVHVHQLHILCYTKHILYDRPFWENRYSFIRVLCKVVFIYDLHEPK
jgi:hypothetical protein